MAGAKNKNKIPPDSKKRESRKEQEQRLSLGRKVLIITINTTPKQMIIAITSMKMIIAIIRLKLITIINAMKMINVIV